LDRRITYLVFLRLNSYNPKEDADLLVNAGVYSDSQSPIKSTFINEFANSASLGPDQKVTTVAISGKQWYQVDDTNLGVSTRTLYYWANSKAIGLGVTSTQNISITELSNYLYALAASLTVN
jgi:hypothetical protein